MIPATSRRTDRLPIQVQVQRNGLTIDKIKQGFIMQLKQIRQEEIAAESPRSDPIEMK
jgi:hypothetical protein